MQVDRALLGRGRADPAAELLCEALDLPAGCAALRSREPLGDGAVSGYEVPGSGDPTPLYFVDTSRLPVARETGWAVAEAERPGAERTDGDERGGAPEARIWRHPEDPHLPALPAVAFPKALETLLARAGITAAEVPEMVAYRPGRRAVLRVVCAAAAGGDGAREDLWVKIVRPSRVDRIVAAQTACAEAGLPVPGIRFWSPEGLLVFDAASGTPAADVEWHAERLLDQVDELRARFAEVRSTRPLRGVAGRLEWYASGLRSSSASGERAAALAARIARRLAELPPAAAAVVHGDLHFGQLFLDDLGEVSGVIDVDTLGVGDPAEDPAAFLGHAIASALLTEPGRADRVWRLADAAAERWAGEGAAGSLAAIHLLGHALAAQDRGDAVMQERLLVAAGTVLDGLPPSAASVDEKPLTRPLAEV